MSKTKEGIEVKEGQVWEDCDPRMAGRRVVVHSVWPGMGHYAGQWFASVYPNELHTPNGTYRRASKLRVSRMHNHRNGWKLVQ